jgi:Mg2+-importing ATPase
LPFTPAGGWFGFEAPPWRMTAGLGAIVIVYLVCAELAKQAWVKRRTRHRTTPARAHHAMAA